MILTARQFFSGFIFFFLIYQKSSSSESLSDKGSELKKSFDAVVFDVLKVTPEEYAVSLPSLVLQFLHILYILVLFN